PVHPTPLFQLFDEAGHDPGILAECARRCIAQTKERPPVLVAQFHGLAVVGASLGLEGRIVGAAVGGYALSDFSQVSEVQRLAQQSGIVFERVWEIARKQPPVPQQRLIVHGELLQVLGEALLRENYRTRQYEQAAAIVDSSDDAIISIDRYGVITSWNKGAERLYGYLAEEAFGQPVAMLLPQDRQHEAPEILARIMRGEPIDHFETVRVRKDGSPFHVSLTVSPIKDSASHVIGASKIARDISERRWIEEHRTVLINELNHRVKNTLATVQSLASQTLRNAKSTADAREVLDARLLALAKAHDVLTREHWTGAGLNEVITEAIDAYSGERQAIGVHAGGPDLRLRTISALALSMALHELATNAVKYGALSTTTGTVAIDWRIADDDPPRFRLCWTETGGPPVEEPSRRGFGSRLVESGLAQDLGG
ncbi:MAG: sensor histidine kinase, partial [Methylocella sp.]